MRNLFDSMLPRHQETASGAEDLASLLAQHGFDTAQHQQIQAGLKSGRLGLAQNRLPSTTLIEDVLPGDFHDGSEGPGNHSVNAA